MFILFLLLLFSFPSGSTPLAHSKRPLPTRLVFLTRSQQPQHPDALVTTSGAPYNHTVKPNRCPSKLVLTTRLLRKQIPNQLQPRPQQLPTASFWCLSSGTFAQHQWPRLHLKGQGKQLFVSTKNIKLWLLWPQMLVRVHYFV